MSLKALARRVLERNRASNSNASEQLQGTQLSVVTLQPRLQSKLSPAALEEWNEDDWRTNYDERAAIAQYDGGMSRETAEAQAYECTLVEWLTQHPPLASSPDRCAYCNSSLPEHEALPLVCGTDGLVWLHGCCHGEWMTKRKDDACRALAAMGINEKSHKRKY